MRKAAFSLAIMALAWPLLAASPARAQEARTWVSGTGDDANPCSRTAPCRTFSAALAVTAPGGEINCLDAGQFGGALINFSLTISCAAGTAGVLVPNASTGIAIQAASTDVVTLRGLDIDGQGSGANGIYISSAKAVHVEKCTIRNIRGVPVATGIVIPTVSSTIFLFVSDTVISGNKIGVLLHSSGGFKVASLKHVTITGSGADGLQLFGANLYANVTESIISGNAGSAVSAAFSGTTINIDRSTIANNGTGATANSGSIIRASGNNIYNNATGFSIGAGAFIQSDSTNNTGGSNGGLGAPNASLAKN